MTSKILNKLLKNITLLSPLLISVSAVNGVVNKVGSSQKVSISPIKNDDVQLIATTTWNEPSTGHDPTVFAAATHDRYYRLYFSPATVKLLDKYFRTSGQRKGEGFQYITTNGQYPIAHGSQSKLFYQMLHGDKGLFSRDDFVRFNKMTATPGQFDEWYQGTPYTYKGKPRPYFHKYRDSEGYHDVKTASQQNLGAGMYLYCDYRFMAPDKYGMAYGYGAA